MAFKHIVKAHTGGVVKSKRDGTLTLRDSSGDELQLPTDGSGFSVTVETQQSAGSSMHGTLRGFMQSMKMHDGEPYTTYVRMSINEQALAHRGSIAHLQPGQSIATPAGTGRIVSMQHDAVRACFELEVQVDHAREGIDGQSFAALVIDEPPLPAPVWKDLVPDECKCQGERVRHNHLIGAHTCARCGAVICTDEQLRRGELPF